jgi:hypothetical protein
MAEPLDGRSIEEILCNPTNSDVIMDAVLDCVH